jgi:hypothetical protein
LRLLVYSLSASNINLTENESATNKIEIPSDVRNCAKLIGSTIHTPFEDSAIGAIAGNIKTISPALISASPGLNPLNAPTTSLADRKYAINIDVIACPNDIE